jgi:PAS domain S-box-containing protein
LRLLLVAANSADAERILHSLQAGGYAPEITIVEEEQAFIEALDGSPQVILTDYSLPNFPGLRVIDLARTLRPEIPILVSGRGLGDEAAAECIKRGASDHLLRGDLTRVASAVTECLQSAELTQAMLENTQEAVFVCDASGRVVRANGPARLLGSSSIIGRLFRDAVPLEPRAAGGLPNDMPTGIKRSLRGVEATLSLPSGPLRVLVNGGVFGGAEPNRKFLVTLTDVTELRHLERLHESERRFGLLLNTSPVPMVMFDEATGHIVDVNDAFVASTGYERGESVGHKLRELGFPAQPAEWQAIHQTVQAEGRVVGVDVQFRTKAGALRDGTAAIQMIETHDAVVCVVAVIDVSDRKRAEDALGAAKTVADAANEAKSEFLSRMSHELRTPLNVVLGFSQVLELGELREDQREAVGYIRSAGLHLLALIDEVLDISGIEAGRSRLSMEPVDLAGVVDEAVQLMNPVACSAQVGISVLPPPEVGRCWVRADRHRLKQVMLNLLSNAIKYNREGGAVIVGYRPESDGRMRVSISDTGRGIPPNRMQLLFQPFERLGAEASSVPGTGLGLALSKRLVQTMGGSITGENSGTAGMVFAFDLATAPPGPAAKAPGSAVTIPTAGFLGPKTVLYIEDNLENVALVEYVLKQWPGVRLISAMQGRMALDLARQHHPDLVLLDLHLPDIGGDEVLRQLKADPATAGIPVLVASADATTRQIERLKAAGAVDYLTKPLNIRQFLIVLGDLLGVQEAK